MATDGCATTKTVNIAAPPTAISGSIAGLCPGTTQSLSDGISGGTWSSSNTAVATIGSVTGLLNTINGGTANMLTQQLLVQHV